MNKRSVRSKLAYAPLAVLIACSLLLLPTLSSLPRLAFGPGRDDVYAPSATPDFARYDELHTLSPHEFPIDEPDRRVIIVGDLHGKYKYLKNLLDSISYNPPKDVLVHVGDVTAKSSLPKALTLLNFLSSNNITGVRGNHDQNVVEWRGWLNWIHTLPGGSDWLADETAKWAHAHDKGTKLKIWNQRRRNECKKNDCGFWWKRIPKSWRLFGDHFKIAEAMTVQDYEYLIRLPLKIHVPSANAFIIHAGLLSSDPKYPPDHHKQPLARRPIVPRPREGIENIPLMRRRQESRILTEVEPNTDPYINLNLRSIQGTEPTRAHKGLPWSNIWNRDMSNCQGYQDTVSKDALPCYPSTVVYGHAASRGLDIKRWTVGIDSGCVTGNRLSALIIGGPIPSDEEEDNNGDSDGQDQAILGTTNPLDEEEDEMDAYAYIDDDILADEDEEDEEHYGEYDEDEGQNAEGEADDDDTEANKKKKPKKKTPKTPKVIPFGDNRQARIVSVPCHK
ncbi:Metallo-dependent phosphatase [Pluteus cervinus]|uniref:Metallo-dependent phosphatase n=1 Tax=Pluteus cervinus TaxID=181527 RepID=A0ACD3BB20_9AGAR|nr:Metallo-dependent phosphatase [Pluteus cervinus]